MTTIGIQLTESLRDGSPERAVSVLQAYFAPLSGGKGGFTGGAFDLFDPAGDRSANSNVFTADDLVAVSFLSVTVPPRAALEILVHQRRRFASLLESIGPDRDPRRPRLDRARPVPGPPALARPPRAAGSRPDDGQQADGA